MIDFRNTKIQILSPEHSEAFQNAVFEAGGKWASGGSFIDHVDKPYLFVGSDMELYWVWSDLYIAIDKDYKEITFPFPSTKEGHVHQALMAQYAEDAKTNPEPWKLWEFRRKNGNGDWHDCLRNPRWVDTKEYRRKPKMKLIHGVEVPDISFVPKYGELYYYPDPVTPSYIASKIFIDGHVGDEHRARHGLCYPVTEEGKQASILHAKVMIDVINSGEDE